MRSSRIAALLLWVCLPVSAAVSRPALPIIELGAGSVGGPHASAALSPILSAFSFPLPVLATAACAPIPAEIAASALAATKNGLIRTSDVSVGLAELRAASHESHPLVAEIVARINAVHPELPISNENLFMVRDAELLKRLDIPKGAAGAARVVSDGRAEVPVVILAAPVALDDFVEFGVHEAVHLMDGGILRVPHDEELKHSFAEGWTQKRALAMANDILNGLGRPSASGKAYHREIALVEAFIALHGTAALDELVRTGSDEGLRRALGERWALAERISGGGSWRWRDRRLDALIALIRAERIGPDDERALLEHAGRR